MHRTGTTRHTYTLDEHHLYGASRLGMEVYDNVKLADVQVLTHPVFGTIVTAFPVTVNDEFAEERELKMKRYELNSHQSSVHITVSDRKLSVEGAPGQTAHYLPDVVFYGDYYSAGMLKNGRHGQETNIKTRYKHQGQEGDDEINGEGNSYAYEYRMSDPRTVRFWSLDPLSAKYAYNSPYAFSENRVIDKIELEGLEASDHLYNSRVREYSKGNITAEQLNAAIDYHTALDIIGTVPILGEAADALNALLYSIEGDYESAGFSAASMLPLVGWFSTGAKFTKNAFKVVVKEGDYFIAQTIKSSEVWSKMHPFVRGRLIESIWQNTKYKAKGGWERVGKAMKGYFPAIDFWNEAKNAVVSLKTMGENALLKGDYSELYENIDDMANAEYKIWGKTYTPDKTLEIVIPEGADKTLLNSVVDYGKENNVKVKISEF